MPSELLFLVDKFGLQGSMASCCNSLVPRPRPKIGKEAWCHLQTFLYVLNQHVMQQLHALLASFPGSPPTHEPGNARLMPFVIMW